MQEVHDFHQRFLCFVFTGHILECNAGLLLYIYLGIALAHAHGSTASAHSAEQKTCHDPDQYHRQYHGYQNLHQDCAICDGFFFKNKNVAVIGSGEYALHEAEVLKNVTDKVSIFTNGGQLPENRSIEIQNVIEGKIDSIRGEKKVESIVLEDNRSIPVDGIFIAEGIASSSDFAKKLGIIVRNNNILVNENMETNVPGIYAAGDCTGGLLQICKAIYEGAKCGLSIAKQLKNI